MSKDINTITEELMMKYVEGNMDSNESDKFEKILSKNEYLKNRVDVLKAVIDANPLESPSDDVHKKVLSSLNISNEDEAVSSAKKTIDSFMSIFEKKPILMGSALSGIAAIFIFFIFKDDNINKTHAPESHNYYDYTYDDEGSDKLEKNKDEESQD